MQLGHRKFSTALITGAARGLGNALALELAPHCEKLLLIDKDNVSGTFDGCAVTAIQADLSKPDGQAEVQRHIATVELDILINNAGVLRISPFDVCTNDEIDSTVAVNLIAPLKLSLAAFREMKKRKRGHIVNILSKIVKSPKRDHAIYAATKFGLEGFARSFFAEARENNIRITSVYPGGIMTGLYGTSVPSDVLQGYMNPFDVAHTIVDNLDNPRLNASELVVDFF